MAKRKGKADATPPQWVSGPDAFKEFATHEGKTQSGNHIKPLHWYIACRLVLEGGFPPSDITPRPPFKVETKTRKGKQRQILIYDPASAVPGEQVVLGGLKTKNVDVVVNRYPVGPVLAVSCKGVTKAFRNLTNRMEETIGECTNLHITYPAMVIGYFAVLRANKTLEDVEKAPDLDDDEAANEPDGEDEGSVEPEALSPRIDEKLKANDIAIQDDGSVVEGIRRFHQALRDMTGRKGIRDEISRYEAMTMALIKPQGVDAGGVLPQFPPDGSPLLLKDFFQTLYQRYEERFVYGAPSLAERGYTTRLQWDPESPVFVRNAEGASAWPVLDFEPRIASE